MPPFINLFLNLHRYYKRTQIKLCLCILLCTYKLQSTEEQLKKEANLADLASLDVDSAQADSEVSSVLSAYKSEGDPDAYEGAYTDLKKFVESSLDIYKVCKLINTPGFLNRCAAG
jgi:hypothetical protein